MNPVKPLPRALKPLPLKALYTPLELAESIGISRHVLLRLVRMQGVVVYRVGRKTLIPISEIRDKLEPLWDAISTVEHGRN